MPLSAVDAISPAFQHAKEQLLQPFRASQWAKLALVGFLAGELSSGGCNFGSGNFQLPHQPHSDQMFPGPFPHLDPMAYAGLIAGLIITSAVLWILFLYINSVMRFVLFDSVVNRRCEIRKSWSARHSAGLRYFVWQIFVMLSMVVFMIILVGIPAAFGLALGWMRDPRAHIVPLVLGGIVLFFVLLALIGSYFLIHVFTKDFVVPQMAIEEISALEGWRRLLSRINREKGGFAGYIGMKIVMALGAGSDRRYCDRVRRPDRTHSRRRTRAACRLRWKSRRPDLESLHHFDCHHRRVYAAGGHSVYRFAYFSAHHRFLPRLLTLLFCRALRASGCLVTPRAATTAASFLRTASSAGANRLANSTACEFWNRGPTRSAARLYTSRSGGPCPQ